MKRSLLLFLIIFPATAIKAQVQFGAVKKEWINIHYIEFNSGPVFPMMLTFNHPLSNEQTHFLTNSMGLAYRLQFNKNFSFSPQFSHFQNGLQVNLPDSTRFSTSYFSLYTPIDFEFRIRDSHKMVAALLFVFGGPYLALNNSTSFKTKHYDSNTGLAIVKKWDMGFEAGMGIRLPVFFHNNRMNFSIKPSFFYGLENILDAGSPLPLPEQQKEFLNLTGHSLKNSGIRLLFSIEICLNRWHLTSFTAGGNKRSTYDRYVVIKNRNVTN